jgi:hypothetical protein
LEEDAGDEEKVEVVGAGLATRRFGDSTGMEVLWWGPLARGGVGAGLATRRFGDSAGMEVLWWGSLARGGVGRDWRRGGSAMPRWRAGGERVAEHHVVAVLALPFSPTTLARPARTRAPSLQKIGSML